MKKLILFMVGAAAVGWSHAQTRWINPGHHLVELPETTTRIPGLVSDDREAGDVLVADDFSDFSNWTLSTLGGTTPEWELVLDESADLNAYVGDMMSPTADNGFATFDGVSYLLAGSVDPIDAILEYNGTIDCGSATAVIIEFFAAYRAFNYDQFFVEVTNDGWATYESFELFTDLPTNDPAVQEFVSVNASLVAAGESEVKVRFRFKELSGDDAIGSGYGAMIDDFSVSEGWNYDMAIEKVFHRSDLDGFLAPGLTYYQIPLTQAVPIQFSALVENYGSLTQPNAKLNVSVTGAAAYSGTSIPVDLAVAAKDSFACATTFTPSVEGVHEVKYWVDSDGAEEETANDTMTTEPIVITGEAENFAYGRDNGVVQGSIGNVATNSGLPFLIGNVMKIEADDTISSVSIAISDDIENVGELMYGQIMVFDEGTGDFIYLDQTGDHEIIASDLGGFVTLDFDDNIPLDGGQYILLMAGHYGGSFDVRFQMAQKVAETSVLGLTASWDIFFLSNPSAIMIRGNMETAVFIDTDGDGVLDEDELLGDSDEDGIPDVEDPDDDGDGIPTSGESGDTDGDGIPNYLDTDDDGDGIPTEDESGDTDGNGIPNYLDNDDDGDGILTETEIEPGLETDSDEDGIPDYLDTDDDGDGVATIDELDPNGDDVLDDTDGDGIPNYLDTDDDGDSLLTEDELDANGDGVIDDTDGDGLPNYLDNDDDGDGDLTIDEIDEDGDGVVDDTDGDGVPNYLEETALETIGINEQEQFSFDLGQNYPNPFGVSTIVTYHLQNGGNVQLDITDATGRLVKRLQPGTQGPGDYQLTIEATELANGLYYYTLTVGEEKQIKTMVVSK